MMSFTQTIDKNKKTIGILKNIIIQLNYLQNNQELLIVNENQ